MKLPADIRYCTYAAISMAAIRRVVRRISAVLPRRGFGRRANGTQVRYNVALRGVSRFPVEVGLFSSLNTAHFIAGKIERSLNFVLQNDLAPEWFKDYEVTRSTGKKFSCFVMETSWPADDNIDSDIEESHKLLIVNEDKLGSEVAIYLYEHIKTWLGED